MPGECRRYIARCLNIGTRMRCINEQEVRKAFDYADKNGAAIMGFTNHDFRDMEPDIELVQSFISNVQQDYPDVKFKFSDVREAFNIAVFGEYIPPAKNLLEGQLEATGVEGQLKLTIEASDDIFGPQPFLAVETKDGQFHHDNFDFQTPFRKWSYIFDEHTFPPMTIHNIGIATNDKRGYYHTLHFSP